MSKASIHSFGLGRASSSSRTFGKFVIVIPILACAYAEIILPLLLYADVGPRAGASGLWTAAQSQILNAPRLEHRIFWPLLASISLILAARNWSRLTFPPHIICLFAYLAFAGVSVSWAFKPEYSSIRFFQQVMIVTSIILPALMAANSGFDARRVSMLRACFDH